MAKEFRRILVSYLVCCDCELCRKDTGGPIKISKTERTASAAHQWLKGKKKYHPSLFFAMRHSHRSEVEALNPISQRKPKPKAATMKRAASA